MIKYLIYLIIALSILQARAQTPRQKLDSFASDFHSLSLQRPKASIYISTSKSIYETNEDLWFKATILNSHLLVPFLEDKTLYVQLRNIETDSVIHQSKYGIENGFCAGRIFIDYSLRPGNYFLEAYSKSSFDPKSDYFIANRKIRIVESILNNSTYSAHSYTSPKLADFQLLPEGGHLVDGIQTIVAFKSVDSIGNPVEVAGLIKENGKPIAHFKTEHDGMGSFIMTPIIGRNYVVALDTTDEKTDLKVKFPVIERRGMTFKLDNKNNDTLRITLKSNTKAQQIYVRVQTRGMIQALATGYLSDSLQIQIPTNEFPHGIHEITLLNENLRPTAERLVYINKNKILNVKALLSKKSYGKKEKVSIKLKVTDQNGNPVQGNLGISVYDQKFDDPTDGKTILTHYHLEDAIKGKIYNPSYYFEEDASEDHLDLLLLTQGWRKYKWNDDDMKRQIFEPVLDDGIIGQVIYTKNNENDGQQAIMIFDPITEDKFFEPLDSKNGFYVNPNYLKLGKQIYVQHFENDKKNQGYVRLQDNFRAINNFNYQSNYPMVPHLSDQLDSAPSIVGSDTERLEEVLLSGKGSNQYANQYLGKLDSLANVTFNSDYLGIPCGTFNCQVHPFDQSKKPIAGETYEEMIGFEWVNESERIYKIDGHRKFKYEKINYTEEELKRKFNLTKIDGYGPEIEFYSPNYETEDSTMGDYRNTLLWKPNFITDKKGVSDVEFYTSDLVSRFLVRIECVSKIGYLGLAHLEFLVY